MPLDLSGEVATPKPRRPVSADTPAPSWMTQLRTMGTTAAAAAPKPSYDPNAIAAARAELAAILKLGEEAQPGVAGGAPPAAGARAGRVLVDVGAQDRYQADIDEAQAKLDAALNARRDEALKVPGEKPQPEGSAPKPGNIAKQTEPMTWEDYNALTPLRRSAVDYNTSLTRAVRRDRQMQDEYSPGDQQREAYDKTVARLFGEDGGSDWYAPETVALLQQIKLNDPLADLDDFLNLKTAITEKDLRGLTDYTLPIIIHSESPATERADMVRDLAVKTGNLEETLAKGDQMLQTMRATSIKDRNAYVSNLGGIPKAAPTMLGYGAATQIDSEGRTVSTMDGHFQRAFDLLARKDGDRDALLAQLAQGSEPGQMEDFMRYVDARSRNSAEYGIDLGGEKGQKYLTPEEFRVKLGLEPKGDSNG